MGFNSGFKGLNDILQGQKKCPNLHICYDYFSSLCRITVHYVYIEQCEKGYSLRGLSQYTSLGISHCTCHFTYVTSLHVSYYTLLQCVTTLHVRHYTLLKYAATLHVSYYILLQYVTALHISYYTLLKYVILLH
jgi:hypothetical protein